MMGTLADTGAHSVGLRLEKSLKPTLTAAMRGLKRVIFFRIILCREIWASCETAESHAHSIVGLLPLNPTLLEGIRHGEEEQASCRP
jgi:hypothetical protein